jgi:hypothetical protein
VPHLPPPADPHRRALLLLLLLARDADLALDQVDSPDARAIVARGLTRGAARPPHGGRRWMCRHRRVAGGGKAH